MTPEIWKEMLVFMVKGFAFGYEYNRRKEAFGLRVVYLMEDGEPYHAQIFDQSVEMAWARMKAELGRAVAEGSLKK